MARPWSVMSVIFATAAWVLVPVAAVALNAEPVLVAAVPLAVGGIVGAVLARHDAEQQATGVSIYALASAIAASVVCLWLTSA